MVDQAPGQDGSTPEQEAARSPNVDVAPDGTLVDEHGPLDPATAEAEIPGHGGWRRGVVGVGVGLVAGLLVRFVVNRPDEVTRDIDETRHRGGW